jgi:hypothetical protein
LTDEILAVVWDLNLAALLVVKTGSLKAGKLVFSTDVMMVELTVD